MSIHNNRTQPAYGPLNPRAHYCENWNILQWWTSKHDEAIARQIQDQHWSWYWEITDKIVAITPPDIIEIWKLVDPLCEKHAWYNVLMNFAAARAEKLGLTESIREAQWKVCPLCAERFVEDSLPHPFVKRLGIDQLDFCAPCLTEALFDESEGDTTSRDQVLEYLRDLADTIERVPPQGFGQGMTDLLDLDSEERLSILKVLMRKPTAARVKELFGSWFEALVDAGVLEGGAR